MAACMPRADSEVAVDSIFWLPGISESPKHLTREPQAPAW